MRGYSGSNPSRYQFTGQYIDNTGLYYYNARYYDPAIGSFLSPDTLVPDPSNVQAYNRYLYALGNPIKYNDPSGHCGMNFGDDNFAVMQMTPCDFAGAVAALAAATVVAQATTHAPPFPEVTLPNWSESYPLTQPSPNHTTLPLNSADNVATIPPPSQSIGGQTSIIVEPLPTVQPGSNIVYAGGTYPNEVGAWGAQQVGTQLPVDVGPFDVNIQGQTRIYDGRFKGTADSYVEIKTSASTTKSSIEITSRIREEVALDAQMAPKPVWVFVGRPPSGGLITLLEANNIPWHQLNPQASPPRPR